MSLPLDDEQLRLLDLEQYRIVGTEPEPPFDRIARLAASLFGAPIAAISFIDADAVWFKACIGLDVCDVPRQTGFCTHAIDGETVMVVPDLARDARFSKNPLVLGPPGIRFYAGAPVATASGWRIGTLCIMDTVPRRALSRDEEAQLASLACLVVDHLELRRRHFIDGVARGFAASTHDALLCIDARGIITFANAAALKLFGYTCDEMIGRNVDIIIPSRFRSAHADGVLRVRGGAPSRLDGKSVELSALRRSGEEFPVEISICSWRNATGFHMGASLRDISERKQRDLRLQRLAHHDPLTGLANRLQIEAALGDAYAAGRPVGVMLLDLDRFKALNDSLGHAAGDALLQTLAVRLQAACDEDAVIARMGGDEFAVVLPGTGDPLRLGDCAASILSALEAPFHLAGHHVQVTISIGGAIGPNHGRDPEELIASADLALYRVKHQGRAGFRLYEAHMRTALSCRRALQDDLIRAFETDEFVVQYQPQVRLESGALIGAEALLRWRHRDRGLLLPGAFLPALENHLLAVEIGNWILDQACRQVAVWHALGHVHLRVGVNLFAAQLAGGTIVQAVEGALKSHNLAPASLELEITENIAVQDDQRALNPLRELRALGVGLAFDDFGTGFASLSALKRVPLTTLKIDRTFVQGLLSDRHDAAVIAAVLGVGHRLGVDVVAEGIETAEQEARLRDLGCQIGQGFRYGPGVSANDLTRAWMSTQASRSCQKPNPAASLTYR